VVCWSVDRGIKRWAKKIENGPGQASYGQSYCAEDRRDSYDVYDNERIILFNHRFGRTVMSTGVDIYERIVYNEKVITPSIFS
jgi:hypothetical protein